MHSQVIVDLLFLFGAAAFVGTIFHFLKLPTLISYIVAGFIVGPHGFGLVSSESEVSNITEIGIGLLMFTIGSELSFSKLWGLKRSVFGLGSLQVGLTTALICILVSLGTDFSWSKSFFIGALIALSSTAVILRLLNESRELVSPHGNAITGVLLFQDIVVIPFMIMVPALAGHSAATATSLVSVLVALGKIIGALLGIWVCSRYLIPKLLAAILKTRSREIFFFFVLFFCFGIAILFEEFGFSASLGAFVAGVIVADSPYGKHALSEITTLRDNFLGIFFISIGMLIDPIFLAHNVVIVLAWVVGIILIKFLIIYGISRVLKYPHNIGFVAAMILANVGEFSFILAEKGLSYGLFDAKEFQYFLSVSILLMISTPFIYKMVHRRTRSVPKLKDTETLEIKSGVQALTQSNSNTKGHAIVVGYGHAGKNVIDVLKQLEIPCLVIDANYDRYKTINKQNEVAIFGDATRPEAFLEAEIDKARLIVLTISGSSMIQASLSNIRRINPDIDVIVRAPYVTDAQLIGKHANTHVIISEFETTFEILKETLKLYDVPTKVIIGFMQLLRQRSENNFDES